MVSNRLMVAGLLALSISSASSLFTSEQTLAQGLRGRLRNAMEGNNQNNSNNQQNPNQQGAPGQQPAAGQPSYGAPAGMSGQQYPGQPAAGGSNVSVVTLQTQPGPGGSQMVVTPKGMVVPLPGPGVNGSAVQVFIGGQGGYWYVDRNGQQVDLTPAVQAMQKSNAQGGQAANVPQYAPTYSQQPQVVNNNYSQPAQSSGSSAMGTAAAAGMGAMAGSAISNSMYQDQHPYGQVPYGAAVHYGANNSPYYNQGGKPVYVNNSSNTAEFNQVNNQHVNSVQQQQDWYNKQQSSQSSNWKNWQQQSTASNPFVRSESQGGQEAAAAGHGQEAAAAAGSGQASEKQGRFGRGESAQGEGGGGRFGKGAGEAGGEAAQGGEGGRRFGRGGGEAGGEEGGGRMGRAASEEGGRAGRGGRMRGNR